MHSLKFSIGLSYRVYAWIISCSNTTRLLQSFTFDAKRSLSWRLFCSPESKVHVLHLICNFQSSHACFLCPFLLCIIRRQFCFWKRISYWADTSHWFRSVLLEFAAPKIVWFVFPIRLLVDCLCLQPVYVVFPRNFYIHIETLGFIFHLLTRQRRRFL